MLKSLILYILAILLPWLVLLIFDNPGGALLALAMQASIVGWMPASIWAFKTIKEAQKLRKTKR